MVWIKLLYLSFLASMVFAKNSKSMVKIIKAFTCELPPKKWDPSPPMVTETSLKKVSRDLTTMFNTYNVTKTFGPVQSKSMVKIIKAFTCELPPKKWDPSPPMVTETSLKKVSRDLTTMFNTYNVTKTFGPVQLGARSFQIQPNAAKYLVFKMENVNCRSLLGVKLIAMSNLKFDEKCMLQQGMYKMEVMDLKNMTRLLKKTITVNGRYSYDVQFSHAKGVTSCITTIIDIYV